MATETPKTLLIDGRSVAIGAERNLLELIRRSGIELPTFCYHSDLSVYGACRLCLVEVEGRGIFASCSTKPEPGMKIRTNTRDLRESRKMTLELLLANHERECPTCSRSSTCSLQNLARQLGVETIRYRRTAPKQAIDCSSDAIERDPNKCILCGDCVRMCTEVQGIGALDFSGRGSASRVAAGMDQGVGDTSCVGCGQCSAVCPTGAIVPRQEREPVWNLLQDPKIETVAQIAPAVRVALGEYFGLAPGINVAGKTVTALKMLGFAKVFDTNFTADLTVVEEANELLGRLERKQQLPLLTSCCPAWVRFVETSYPGIATHLSTCKSPQQMFGAVAKKILAPEAQKAGKKLAVVSIMPCTAKKMEAKLPQHSHDGVADVDAVLTTQEIGRMIHAAGIRFAELEEEPFDQPFGIGSGAADLFGQTGGVMEAALRYAAHVLGQRDDRPMAFAAVRGMDKVREASFTLAGNEVKIAVAHTLVGARQIAQRIQSGTAPWQFVEVMACLGGCVSGGGQPISRHPGARQRRTEGLQKLDRTCQLRSAADNPQVDQCYHQHLGQVGGHTAHHFLHQHYEDRSAVFQVTVPPKPEKL